MQTARWLALGFLAVLVESSLFYGPWLVAWVWLASLFLPEVTTVWIVLVLGVLLDILLVLPVGLSSLILVGFLVVLIYERRIFSSLGTDLFFLVAALVGWGLYRGQNWLLLALVLLITAGMVRVLQPRERGVTLRRA